MRIIALTLAIAGLFLISLWVINLRRENIRLESEVELMKGEPPNPSPSQSPRPPAIETEGLVRRLEQLQSTLNAVTELGDEPPVGSVAAYLEELSERRGELQEQLNSLNQELQNLRSDAQAFTQAQRGAIVDSRLFLNQQIQSLNVELLALRSQPDSEENRRTENLLRIQRDQLEASLRILGPIEARGRLDTAAQVREERAEIEGRRASLREQLVDLNQEIQYWQRQESSRSPANLRAERVEQLRKQIDSLQSDLKKRLPPR